VGPRLAAERTAATAATNAGMAERVARVLQLQTGVPVRTLQQVVLRLDGAGGAQELVRVGLSGTSVSADIGTGSPAEAEAMTARLGELQGALERQGLEAEGLRVRSATPVMEGEAVRGLAMAALAEQLRPAADARSAAAGAAPRDDGDTPARQPRRDANDAHERSRREREGSKKG
jgi:hypothetical protein